MRNLFLIAALALLLFPMTAASQGDMIVRDDNDEIVLYGPIDPHFQFGIGSGDGGVPVPSIYIVKQPTGEAYMDGVVSFASNDCTGTPLVENGQTPALGAIGTGIWDTIYHEDGAFTSTAFGSQLTINGTGTGTACQVSSGTNVLAPAVSRQFTRPFRATSRTGPKGDAVTSSTAATTTFATLLSVSIDTDGGDLEIAHSFGVDFTGGLSSDLIFRLLVDSTVIESAVETAGGNRTRSGAIIALVPVDPDSHTVEIEWKKSSASGAGTINPANDGEHATLVAKEVN